LIRIWTFGGTNYLSTKYKQHFTININNIRKRLAAIGRNKSIESDGVPGEILKLGGEAMIPYLARLLDITINNATIPGDWTRATVLLICKGVADLSSQTTDQAA
jgi:hypothetical protein